MLSMKRPSLAASSLALFGPLCFLLQPVAAVNMTYYAPADNVGAGFANWIYQFYTSAEASNTTAAGYQDFFSPNATVDLGTWNPSQDVIDGLSVRVHYPTAVTIDNDTEIGKTFDVTGFAKGYYKNGTCDFGDYETKFTIAKIDGEADLVPANGSLIVLQLIQQTLFNTSCDSI